MTPEECRARAAHYRGRANEEQADRLVNVLTSVANAYLALASQLDLLAAVESQERDRNAHRARQA